MSQLTIYKYANPAECICVLGNRIIEKLQSKIQQDGQAFLAVSGGRSPIALFQYLSQQILDWDKVNIVLVDERWVDNTDADSNEKLVIDYLIQNKAKSASVMGLKSEHDSAVSAVHQVDEKLKKISGNISVTILGMGTDGHTASFFPNTEELSACLDLNNPLSVCAVKPLDAKHDRITLTLARILKSDLICLSVAGQKKWQVLQAALLGKAVSDMPVRAVLKQSQTPVEVYWADDHE